MLHHRGHAQDLPIPAGEQPLLRVPDSTTSGTGVEALRELVTAGYRPSVARVYSPEDADQHFAPLLWRARTSSCSSPKDRPRWWRPPARRSRRCSHASARERSEPSSSRVVRRPQLGARSKIDAEKQRCCERAPRLHHRGLGRLVERRRALRRGDAADAGRVSPGTDLDDARRALLAQLPDRHQPLLRLRLRHRLRAAGGDHLYHKPINAIVVEEALRLGGSMVHHHGVGKYRTRGPRWSTAARTRCCAALKSAFDPNGDHEPRNHLPAGGLSQWRPTSSRSTTARRAPRCRSWMPTGVSTRARGRTEGHRVSRAGVTSCTPATTLGVHRRGLPDRP